MCVHSNTFSPWQANVEIDLSLLGARSDLGTLAARATGPILMHRKYQGTAISATSQLPSLSVAPFKLRLVCQHA